MSGEGRRAFDVAAVGAGLLALEGRWLRGNAALCTLLGRTQDELLALGLEDVTHPDDSATDARELERLRRREIDVYACEKRLVHQSGAHVWVLQEVTLSVDDGGRPTQLVWQGRDLTERRRARQARREAEGRLGDIVARAPVALWAVDADGVFTLATGSALGAMGPVADRMAVGHSALELYGSVHMVESSGASTTGERLLRRALAGEPCAGLAAIGDARYDTRMTPWIGVEGEVVGVVGVATDVTDRVRAQAHVLQTDRLVAVRALAAGVALEIDNPLTSMVRNLDFIAQVLRVCADRWRDADAVHGASIADTLREVSSALEVARDGSERVRRIVRDLTTFARSRSEHRSLLDVRAIVGPVINLVSNEIRRRARFVRDLRDVPLVDVNEARVGQVFMNLLINAAEAIPEGDAESHEIGVSTYTDRAGQAVFEVWDTGSGMPANVVSRIFEPFFTTRPGGLSTGLGLSICHGIVTALGGEISVESAPGAGSVFRVAIPAAEVGAARSERPPPPVPEQGFEREEASSSVCCVQRTPGMDDQGVGGAGS